VQYLEKRGIHVYGTEGNPKFVGMWDVGCGMWDVGCGMWDGTGQIYLPEAPTVLQVKHELSHYLDFKNLGVQEYVKLSRYKRELLVLERLQKNKIWSELNDLEREFSVGYVEGLKSKSAVRL